MTDRQRFLFEELKKVTKGRYKFESPAPGWSEKTLITQKKKLEKQISFFAKKRQKIGNRKYEEHLKAIAKIRREIFFGDEHKALKMIDELRKS